MAKQGCEIGLALGTIRPGKRDIYPLLFALLPLPQFPPLATSSDRFRPDSSLTYIIHRSKFLVSNIIFHIVCHFPCAGFQHGKY